MPEKRLQKVRDAYSEDDLLCRMGFTERVKREADHLFDHMPVDRNVSRQYVHPFVPPLGVKILNG